MAEHEEQAEQTQHMRHMLRGYESQLLAARRLARLRAQRRAAAAEAAPSPEEQEQRRQDMVRRVAQEMYNSLMYTGTENPVAENIKKVLSETLGSTVEFVYPPGKTLHLLLCDSEGRPRLEPAAQTEATAALWQATMQEIARSMGSEAPPTAETTR